MKVIVTGGAGEIVVLDNLPALWAARRAEVQL